MAKAYTPGLKVSARAMYRARRLLPVHGEVLVKVGDAVKARDVVARTFIEGDVTPVAVASQLSVPAGDLPSLMLVKQGDAVMAGQPLARSRGIFGLGKKEVAAPVAGAVESISATTGQVMLRGAPLPVEVKAYVDGRVSEVFAGEGALVETEAAFVQGIFGVGGETVGPIRMACARHDQPLDAAFIKPDMKGAIVIGGARVTAAAVKAAQAAGVAGIVAGGIDDADLKAPRLPAKAPTMFPVQMQEVPDADVAGARIDADPELDPIVREHLTRTVRARHNVIRACYEAWGLAADARRSGRLVLELTLQPDGHVTDVTTQTNDELRRVGDCVVRAAADWYLGDVVEQPTRLAFPFVLQPRS